MQTGRYSLRFRATGLAFLLFSLLTVALPARAQPSLSAEIVSWQVVGLDSNAPASSAPELFVVQAKVTNNGDANAENASATLTLSSPDCGGSPCIELRSDANYGIGTLSPGETDDAFWTVAVAKTTAAFDTTTPITVTAQADGVGPVTATQVSRDPPPCGSEPSAPSTLFVQNLISQSRNDVLSYSLSPGVQRPDGSWEVTLGSDFTVTVVASTATEYSEISVPATVDPSGAITPSSVNFTYELGTTSDDDVYTLNAGGEVTAEYGYRASALGDVQLAQLIYDCSGNSFHYNSDYLVDAITIHVVAPAPAPPSPTPPGQGTPAISLSKSASPSGTVDPGTRVTFSITYRNSGSEAVTNFVVTDQVDANLINVQPGPGGAYNPATRTITWPIGTVGPGESGNVNFAATVSDFAGGSTIRNVAVSDADQIDPVTSGEVTLTIPSTTPVTGVPAALLMILALGLIGAGDVLASRKLAR